MDAETRKLLESLEWSGTRPNVMREQLPCCPACTAFAPRALREDSHQYHFSGCKLRAALTASAAPCPTCEAVEKLCDEHTFIEFCAYEYGGPAEEWVIRETDTDVALGSGPTLAAALAAARKGA